MTRGKCYSRKKMMGRGAVGGCGTAERPCRPVHRPSSCAPPAQEDKTPKKKNFPYIDVFTQARKALCERSPYDVPEDGSVPSVSVPTLPSGLANLLKYSDGRKRHKKAHAGADKKSSKQGEKVRVGNIWLETEDYFRNLALPDIDALVELCPHRALGSTKCPAVPCAGNHAKADVEANAEAAAHVEMDQNCSSATTFEVGNQDAKDLGEEEGNQFMDNDSVRPPLLEQDREQPVAESAESLEWILGSRGRVILSSERPSKKRKLLSSAAALEKLLVVRPCNKSTKVCHFCSKGDTINEANKLIVCCSCEVAVHRKCYGVPDDIDGKWLCSWCSKKNVASDTVRPCILCPQHGGALKPIDKGIQRGELEFAHLFCALWVPELVIQDLLKMQPILNLGGMKETRKKLICNVCKAKRGSCVRCSHGSCRTSFHPICAREGSHRMEVWGKYECEEIELRAFCSKHSDASDNDNSPCVEDLCDDLAVAKPVVGAMPLKKASKPGLKNGNTVKVHQNIDDAGFDSSCDDELLDLEISGSNADLAFVSNGCDAQFDVSALLRKLIERGKANIKDVALEMDMSAESLSSKLSDYRLVPELRCKIVKWLKSHAHTVKSLENLKSHPVVQSKDVVRSMDESDGVQISESETVDPVTVKSVPPRQQTRSSNAAMVENVELCLPDVIFSDNGTGNVKVNDNRSEKVEHSLSKSPSIDPSEKMVFQPAERCGTLKSFLPETEESSDSNISRVEASLGASVCCNHQSQQSDCNAMESKSVELNVLRSVKGSKLKATGLSPEDEVDGEIIYYQHRLRGNLMTRKHLTDSLACRVVKSIPEEIESARDKRWDSVFVSRYLKKLQDAKKLGRKERKHKEAQAVLAAASAVAAASSRVSSFRKESLEDSGNHENLLKLKASSVSAGTNSQLMSGPKETLQRTNVPKISSDKQIDGFQSLSDASTSHDKSCDICSRLETTVNPILICSCCKVSVHLDCYRNGKESTGPWRCELCEDLLSSGTSDVPVNPYDKPTTAVECGLCGGSTGAFRRSVDGQWVHAFCAEWLLESTFRRGQVNPVEGMEIVSKRIDICCICRRKRGVCIKCNYGNCQAMFHPSCSRRAGFYMIMKTVAGKVQHKAYCEKHSYDQRAKAEAQNQKHGIEELKSIKQIRVELERLRLLCERIIKREKLKRELVLSSHDILTCKKDHVIRSVLAYNPFSPPEVSSESATTSLKGQTDGYRSCSETYIQQSDDITSDSIPAKNPGKVPVFMESDQRTDDSSTSQQLFPKQSIPPDRSKFSGKQIPLKYALASRNISGNGEWNSNLRKPIETLGKELLMTSDEASMKNSRLPKGYCYVPVDRLPKEKPATQDTHSGEGVERK